MKLKQWAIEHVDRFLGPLVSQSHIVNFVDDTDCSSASFDCFHICFFGLQMFEGFG